MERPAVVARSIAPRTAAALLVVAAAVVFASLRLPAALHDFNQARAAEVGRNQDGGALAAADPFGIKDDFVRAAIQFVQPTARFAVVTPDPASSLARHGVYPLTIQALPALIQEVLLPAREVATPVRGTYILCYACDTAPWKARTKWLWSNTGDMAIGKVLR